MTKICTFSRKLFDFTNPEAYEFTVDEIVVALDSIARWSGHTSSKYSVLHHSLCVLFETKARLEALPSALSTEESARIQLQALFHDAAEAYIGDIPTPLKKCLRFVVLGSENTTVEALEHRILRAISRSLFPGCNIDLGKLHPIVQESDEAMLGFEARKLLNVDPERILGRTCAPWLAGDDHLNHGKNAAGTFRRLVQDLRQPLIESAARGFQEVLDLGRT